MHVVITDLHISMCFSFAPFRVQILWDLYIIIESKYLRILLVHMYLNNPGPFVIWCFRLWWAVCSKQIILQHGNIIYIWVLELMVRYHTFHCAICINTIILTVYIVHTFVHLHTKDIHNVLFCLNFTFTTTGTELVSSSMSIFCNQHHGGQNTNIH